MFLNAASTTELKPIFEDETVTRSSLIYLSPSTRASNPSEIIR